MINSILYPNASSTFGAFLHRAQLSKTARSFTRLVRNCAPRLRLEYLLLFIAPAALAQTTITFGFTGTSQTYTVPPGIYSISVVANGGAGGTGTSSVAVAGAQVQATMTVVPGELLAVFIGGRGAAGVAGATATGGYNGGAIGNNNQGGGGGATDLRRTSASSTSDYLTTRNAMLVAAGGGGAGGGSTGGAAGLHLANGGKGGGLSGGYGATQTAAGAGGDIASGVAGGVGVGAPGSAGNGGSGGALGLNAGGGGGGGGGYYGGGGGSSDVVGNAGGGGASSWVMPTGSTVLRSNIAPTVSDGSMTITSIKTPLPVVLVSFMANATGSDVVRLAWSTALERNSASFAVERSTDGQTFTSLVTLKAAGTSSRPTAYSWVDAKLPATPEILYYRLRQTDIDATVTHSPVRTVTQTASRATSHLQAYPNPARDVVSVRVSFPVLTIPGNEYQVFDLQGRLVRTQATSDAATEALLPLIGLRVGTYLLRYGSLMQYLTVE